MVIFGAPEQQPDHAARAVRAAAEVVRRVHALADRWKELGADGFRIGIGIHTGKAVVGTVGSPRRLDYTAIGDTVNTAARLESANKELHTEVLISQATFGLLPAAEKQRIASFGPPQSAIGQGETENRAGVCGNARSLRICKTTSLAIPSGRPPHMTRRPDPCMRSPAPQWQTVLLDKHVLRQQAFQITQRAFVQATFDHVPAQGVQVGLQVLRQLPLEELIQQFGAGIITFHAKLRLRLRFQEPVRDRGAFDLHRAHRVAQQAQCAGAIWSRRKRAPLRRARYSRASHWGMNPISHAPTC